LEADPWGRPYRLVFKKIRAPVAPVCEVLPSDVMSKIIGGLFPTRLGGVPPNEQSLVWNEDWDISEDEVIAAIKKLSGGKKAPGPDGIPGFIIFKTAGLLMRSWIRGFNLCLRESIFPKDWKIAKLVLLYKKDKVEGEPSSYRPICLLNESGKLFERVLAERLRTHLEETNGLSQEQYGFRRGRSTVDAILRLRSIVEEATGEGRMVILVCLDIANAFNSLPWSVIREELAEREVPLYLRRIFHSYLEDRWLCFVGKGGFIRTSRVTCGVPQGSVLGPILWNVGYDRVLRAGLPPGCETLGYADDTAVLVVGDSPQETLNRANICMSIIVGEIKHLGLRVSPLKTEIMTFGGPAGMSLGGVWVDGVLVPTGSSVRYLGLVLDGGWTFRGHFDRLLTRADGMVVALSRLMPNVGGPSSRRRRLYANIIQSIIMYGAPVWALDISRNRKLRERMAAVQRRIALRVICAYRTVSGDAAAILAGLLPGDILARSYRRTYLALQRARRENLELTARARLEIKKRERRLAIREWLAGETRR